MASPGAAIGAAAEAWSQLRAGGEWLFPIVALAVLSWTGTAAALAASFARGTGRTAVVLASLAGGASVLTLGASAGGILIAFFSSFEAIARADLSEAPKLLGAAAGEASAIGVFGIGAGIIPLGANMAVFGVGLSRLFLGCQSGGLHRRRALDPAGVALDPRPSLQGSASVESPRLEGPGCQRTDAQSRSSVAQ